MIPLLILCTVLFVGQRGRPSVVISRHQLETLLGLNFTVPQMAELLGVSVSTLTRRLRNYGLSVRQMYSDITDTQLNELVSRINHQFPSAGYRIGSSLLQGMGHRVPERRVRESMRLVDPISVAYRHSRRGTVDRRRYNVPYPNAMWHVDGNMSLIRWGFVVHGAVDGYSRLITYLHCSTNNYAETVFSQFITAGERFGFPSRTRSDMGGENVDLAHFMVLLRGEGRGSHLTGRSIHNQRIERLWRDVFADSLSLFYHLFYFMESRGILDCENPEHLNALHYVYTPRINDSLQMFSSAWNIHPIRTERNLTPMQLWVTGMMQNFGSNHLPIRELLSHESNELNDSTASESESESEDYSHNLHSTVDPLQHSDAWGVDLYVDALSVLSS